MKSIRVLSGILLAISLCASLGFAQGGYDLFQKALVKERAEGNLKAAIQILERIVKQYPNDRELAAKSLVEMGNCYEGLGKSEARQAYERVLRDYSDQSAAANEARARLAALERGSGTGGQIVARRIWAGPITDPEGAPSPDGKYLTFVDWTTGDLAIRDLITGKNRRLTHKGTWSESNDFAEFSVPSPDGKQVAYAWFTDDGYELRVVNIDGSNIRTLVEKQSNGYVEPKAWTPDGKWILATIWPKDHTMRIALVPAAGGPRKELENIPLGDPRSHMVISQMCISPDGRYLAYSPLQKGDEIHHDVFLLSLDDAREIPIVTHPADDYFLGWAPDGKTMLFASDRTGAVSAWAIEIVNGKPHGSPGLVKADIGRIVPLGLTRNGSFYYALNDSFKGLYSASLDFSSGKVIGPPSLVSRLFAGTNSTPAWSPDGKHLAYLSLRHRPRKTPFDMKPPPFTPCNLGQFKCLGPPYFLNLFRRNLLQVIMNRHQVIGLAPGITELCFKIPFKAPIPQAPVTVVSDLAEVFPQLCEPLLLLRLHALLPAQDIVDLGQDLFRPLLIHEPAAPPA